MCTHLVEEGSTKALLVRLVKHSNSQLIVHRLELRMQLKLVVERDLLSRLHNCPKWLVRVILEVMVELEWRIQAAHDCRHVIVRRSIVGEVTQCSDHLANWELVIRVLGEER